MAIAALPKCKSTAKIPKMKILSHIFDLPYKSGHLYRRLCCLSPFVAEDTTGTVECILLCVHSQHPEYDRRIAVGVERRDALGDALAHIVEMRSPATHHAAEHNHRIIHAGLYQLRGCKRKFHRTGHMKYIHLIFYIITLGLENIKRTLRQGRGYVPVPLCGHNGHPQPIYMGKLAGGRGILFFVDIYLMFMNQ